MIQGMFDTGALPAAERLLQFTTARHKVLTDNIAKLEQPFFQPRDMDPGEFQAALRDAIDERRKSVSPTRGPLELRDTPDLRFHSDHVEMRAYPSNENILFHDQNNRDLERIMQRLAENTMAHQLGVELVRNQFEVMRMAIRERLA